MRNALIRGVLCLSWLEASAFCTCGLPQPRQVCQEFFASPVVVIAKMVRLGSAARGDKVDGSYYSMQVTQRLKGRILNRFRIHEENGSGRTAFDWKRGADYLLFLSYSNEERAWELDGCGSSAPMAAAKKVLTDIERLKTGQEHGWIEGSIASAETLPAGLMVKIEGGGKTRTTMVNNREFKVRVEPGKYVVTPEYPGWLFIKDDFSYDDPAKIKIDPGRCAQIQFQAEPTR